MAGVFSCFLVANSQQSNCIKIKSHISLCQEKQVIQDAFEIHQLNSLLITKGFVLMLKRETGAGEMHSVWYTSSDVL